LPHLVELVRPIELLLLERIDHKMIHNVDELLRRIELGVLHNTCIQDRDILIFCYQVIQDAFKVSGNDSVQIAEQTGQNTIPLPQRKKTEVSRASHFERKIGKLVRFGLELVRSILKKHKELKTPANIAGFLPIIGDAMIQNQADIKMSAMRFFTEIVAVPLQKLNEAAAQYVQEAIKTIDDSSSTGDELSQAALKLVATTLRERKSIELPEASVVLLLNRIKPDLQVISQQGVAFNLIRSIMSRKIVIPEVYELIDGDDGIAAISVRDHDRTTRDLARGVYFQFIMEYPQGKKRFGKQLVFLIRNLEYEYPEGRQSVMETLNLLLNKTSDDLVQSVVHEAFWPVVSIMINDSNSDCRTMASGLVKTVFSRADEEWCKSFLTLLRKMLDPTAQKIQQRTALQCWTAYLEAQGSDTKDVTFVLQSLEQVLQSHGDMEETWQLRYYALRAILAICKELPSTIFSSKTKLLWLSIWAQLSFSQSWVKLEAAKAIELLISQVNQELKPETSISLMVGSGLSVSRSDLCDLTSRHLCLFYEPISLELASQVVKNLTFLGRYFGDNEIAWKPTSNNSGTPDVEMVETSDESEDETQETNLNDSNSNSTQKLAIHHLLSRLTFILRKESFKRQPDNSELLIRRATSLIPRIAALQILHALVPTLPTSTLSPSLSIILRPLLHLNTTTPPTSAEEAFTETYADMTRSATELLDELQKRVGTSEFVEAVGKVREAVAERREERRRKRKVVEAGLPEVRERRKIKKREKEKVRRKEKGLVQRGKRRGW
jgi:U3 small nucleolar RNA-associated protein 20